MQRPSEGRRRHSGVMYARSASLAAAHLIAPDANEVLKSVESRERCAGERGRRRRGKRFRGGCWRWRGEERRIGGHDN